MLKRLLADDRGATLSEYALLAALIAVVAIAALSLLGGKIKEKIDTIANCLGNTTAGQPGC
ncbi:MAG: Flp family type IVb pilin [Armatimonadota bacterium]|nr:Flp family type IVb pilin [Armatimonadota bacterium]